MKLITMSRKQKQTRRSISIRGSTYERVSAYCDEHDISRSQFFEDRVLEFLGAPKHEESDDDSDVIEEPSDPVVEEVTEDQLPLLKNRPHFLQPEPEKVTVFRPDVSDADEFAGGYKEF